MSLDLQQAPASATQIEQKRQSLKTQLATDRRYRHWLIAPLVLLTVICASIIATGLIGRNFTAEVAMPLVISIIAAFVPAYGLARPNIASDLALYSLLLAISVGSLVGVALSSLVGSSLTNPSIWLLLPVLGSILAASISSFALSRSILLWGDSTERRADALEALNPLDPDQTIEVRGWLTDPLVRSYVDQVANQNRKLVLGEFKSLENHIYQKSAAEKKEQHESEAREAEIDLYSNPTPTGS